MTTYELREVDDQWQVLRNGKLFRNSPHRSRAIDMVACEERFLLRSVRDLGEPGRSKQLQLSGFTLKELQASVVWLPKYPRVDFPAFDEAEAYLDAALPHPESTIAAYLDYEHAMHQKKYSAALDQLILLGDALDCPPQYWEALQTLAESLWVGRLQNIPTRKARGQLETKIEFIERRRKGDRLWNPKLHIEEIAR